MVDIEYNPHFDNFRFKLKDRLQIEKIKKLMKKIIDDPEIGKPMRYDRKGTRELYLKPFRIAYFYSKDENKLIFLDIYHKDEQ